MNIIERKLILEKIKDQKRINIMRKEIKNIIQCIRNKD